jgi:FdhE protein
MPLTRPQLGHDHPMEYSWDRRVARAHQLAAANEDARPLLTTYARLLELQSDAARALAQLSLTGGIEQDLHALATAAHPMLTAAVTLCPLPVATAITRLLHSSDTVFAAALVHAWEDTAGFTERFVLQPYAEQLAARRIAPSIRRAAHGRSSCPFCGGSPQLSILHADDARHGGGRSLQCAMCSTIWPSRRVVCANCGEEDEHRLAYYVATGLEHVRVDACDTCRQYLKAVDVTRLGHAVPVVDEIATSALDVWAVQHGYCKVELSLVGT